jgi:Asp-tRNA(Asn)/Glu-tRNA(Gln) amidotransferase A subunit family amidase
MANQNLDALAYPTIRRKAAPLFAEQDGSNCQLSAKSGLPAISIPAGFTDDGLPVGLELLGRAWSEADLLAMAYAFEQLTRHRRPPPLLDPDYSGTEDQMP